MPSNIQFHPFKKKSPGEKGRLLRQDLRQGCLLATALNRGVLPRACANHDLFSPQYGAPGRKPMGEANHQQDRELTHVPFGPLEPGISIPR